MNTDTEAKLPPLTEEDIDAFASELAEFDEAKCESIHADPMFPCSGTVEFRISDCTVSKNVCAPAAEGLEWKKWQHRCDKCGRLAHKCWTSHPV